MSAGREKKASPDAERLEAAIDQAIAACGGDARAAIRALIVVNEFYEAEYSKLVAQVIHASSARAFGISSVDREFRTEALRENQYPKTSGGYDRQCQHDKNPTGPWFGPRTRSQEPTNPKRKEARIIRATSSLETARSPARSATPRRSAAAECTSVDQASQTSKSERSPTRRRYSNGSKQRCFR